MIVRFYILTTVLHVFATCFAREQKIRDVQILWDDLDHYKHTTAAATTTTATDDDDNDDDDYYHYYHYYY